jgi:ketosteroid isomerase-like protein
MHRRIPAATLFLAAALALPVPVAAQQSAARASAQPPAALVAAADAYVAAWNGTDPAAVLSFFAADGVVLINGNKLTRGELLERWIGPNVAQATGLQSETHDQIVDRNRVVQSGRYWFRAVAPGQASQMVYGIYSNTWERQRDGSWKIRSSTLANVPVAGSEAVVRRLIEEGWNKRNLAVIDEVIAADAVRYDNGVADAGRGPATARAFMEARLAEMPDLHFTIDELLTQGDRVVARWSAKGTNKEYGRPVAFNGTTVYRVQDGKITESRVTLNQLSILQALGYTVTAPVRLAQP